MNVKLSHPNIISFRLKETCKPFCQEKGNETRFEILYLTLQVILCENQDRTGEAADRVLLLSSIPKVGDLKIFNVFLFWN